MYPYDDFRVTFRPRSDGNYDMTAEAGGGQAASETFVMPFTLAELSQGVVRLAEGHREARARRAIRASGATDEASADQLAGRDVAAFLPTVGDDARAIGGALAAALLTGNVGDAYRHARHRASSRGHGVRLSLSLAASPALLCVPWEYLFERPRFLAAGPSTPVVRVLDVGGPELRSPPPIRSVVRILGVVSNPVDLPPLDVADERRRIELALKDLGDLVEIDWVEPATPRRLRQALLDGGDHHVLHYIGHGTFMPSGGGALYMEHDDDQRAVAVDETLLANLLSFHVDRQVLRLVVLNSCEGARTALTDPFAGVATTLVQLGVPAVVAMQFEISDEAARVFAEEFYTDIVRRRMPIDVAVAAARKALLIEVDPYEWATPVLFLRDPTAEIFRFGDRLDVVPKAALEGGHRTPQEPRRRLSRWLFGR